jgi:hypothetical protein
MFRSTGWQESPWVVLGCVTVIIVIVVLMKLSNKK